MKMASLNSIGSIALQGIRQAEVQFGENCLIIGLGLLGQLTGNMLSDMNVSVVGIDPDLNKCSKALDKFADHSFTNSKQSISNIKSKYKDGFDSVFICAKRYKIKRD